MERLLAANLPYPIFSLEAVAVDGLDRTVAYEVKIVRVEGTFEWSAIGRSVKDFSITACRYGRC